MKTIERYLAEMDDVELIEESAKVSSLVYAFLRAQKFKPQLDQQKEPAIENGEGQ